MMLNGLMNRYHIDFGEAVKQYFDETENFDNVEIIDWKDCFNKCVLMLKSLIEDNKPQQQKPQPQPQQPMIENKPSSQPIIEEIETVEEIEVKPQKPSNEKTFDGFLQILPNGEILIDDLTAAYNSYFGTNITNKGICQKKEIKDNFNIIKKTEKRKTITYYSKK